MRKVFRLKVILITLACIFATAIVLPLGLFLFSIGVGMGLGDDPGWMHPSTYSGSSPPQWTMDDSEIVFAQGGSIYAARSDGSSLRLIHGEDGENDLHHSPDVSPDGRTLAYQKLTNDGFYSLFMDNSRWQIARSLLDGSDERVLTHDLYILLGILVAPSWSPDGRRIMFTSDREIHTIAPDGSDMRLVKGLDTMVSEDGYVRLALTDMMPLSWAPDGQRIGFMGIDGSGNHVASYTMGANGVGLQRVWEGGSTPVWSPDGNRLAFAVSVWDAVDRTSYAAHLFTTKPDGSNPRRVASLPKGVQWDRVVEWSPSGEELLFGPFVASVDSSMLVVLPPPDRRGVPPPYRRSGHSPLETYSLTSWSNDGSRIAILTEYHSVLYTVARDGTGSRVLVERDEGGNLVAAGGRPLSEGQTVQTIPPDG